MSDRKDGGPANGCPISDKHLTVVFTVNDKAAFDAFMREYLQPHMKPSAGEPWSITAFSRDHELHRLSLIEDALDAGDMDAVDAVRGTLNVGDYESIAALLSEREGSQ